MLSVRFISNIENDSQILIITFTDSPWGEGVGRKLGLGITGMIGKILDSNKWHRISEPQF